MVIFSGILYNIYKKGGADMRIGFGVDLGGTTVKIAAFRDGGDLLSKWEIPTATERNGAQILSDIAASVLKFCEENEIVKENVIGLGIGVPGAVDDRGIVPSCENLGWGEVAVCEELSKLSGFSVKAANDANVAALGEAWKGSDCDNMVLITLGTGVGGGIIVDGKPLRGATGGAGEIGHMVLNRRETRQCNCGKYGCVEQYCSATGIVQMAKDYLAETAEASILRDMEKITAKAVFDAAADGDAVAQNVLEQVYAYMGEFIANICAVLNPRLVVIGGGVSKAGEPLLAGIRKNFHKYVYYPNADVEFKLATLGNDAGVYGAFKLILQ